MSRQLMSKQLGSSQLSNLGRHLKQGWWLTLLILLAGFSHITHAAEAPSDESVNGS